MRNEFSDAELLRMSGQQTEHGQWSHLALLMAQLIDTVNAIAHGLGGAKGDPPQVPRPGISTVNGIRPGRMTPAEMDLYMETRVIGG